ncbi:related to ethanolamine kinase [Cephalotrichum gorgonifer]|uniref:ethanolamine kinase n=1 Tax=Cephalotrichum gorgonifer TaxID=2041049 RepID=A0AAE8N8F4_9PEZI|nr:related to ethanolamine kinase [Cephalotrichum gorgonifer]
MRTGGDLDGLMAVDAEILFVNQVFDKADPPKSSLELALFLFPELGHHEMSIGDLDVKALTQGTTNGLFKVSHRASAPSPVLIKVYGDGTEITIDRSKELRIHKLLSEKQLSSSPLVRFANGHAYQFISGIVCQESDMTQEAIWRGVARELARWHATLPVIDLRQDEPQKTLDLDPGVWSTAKKWLDAIPTKSRQSTANKDELEESFEYLKERLLFNGRDPHPLVLGHGDLLCGNIIIQDTDLSGKKALPEVYSVKFIDYEHATYCPRAFELANHFAEWAGFECDYNLLPTRATRRGFIREYLQAHADLQSESNGPSELPDQPQVTEAEVDELMYQVDAFRGFPGFYWQVMICLRS